MVRLEAYNPASAPLRRVAREFGGTVERIDSQAIVDEACAPRKPLRLGRDMAIMDAHGHWPKDRPKPRVLLRIGSAMAFGTGEHATTAACLRFLREETARMPSGWTALDIGTGSGILAMAAEKFGASDVTAFDYDPRAVRAAQGNARRNRCAKVAITAMDVREWRPGRKRHRLIMANLFSELLRAAAPRIIRALSPDGTLILSGILRFQEKETLETFLSGGLVFEKAARRGKWVSLLLRAPRR